MASHRHRILLDPNRQLVRWDVILRRLSTAVHPHPLRVIRAALSHSLLVPDSVLVVLNGVLILQTHVVQTIRVVTGADVVVENAIIVAPKLPHWPR